jgi:peptidoglycan/xylan/chitin deacetylase (PgdA/CDA1 family)
MTSHTRTARFAAPLVRALGNSIAPRGKGDGRLCIVTYHRILETKDPLLESEPDVATFAWQMESLARSFNVLPLYDAVMALKEKRMPPRAVCITFDDGYRSTHDLALPILQRLNLPATVFITSGYLDEGSMWNDRIIDAVRRLPGGQLDLRDVDLGVYQLADEQSRTRTVQVIGDHCKYLPPAGRESVISRLESIAGMAPGASLMLNKEMVANLGKAGIEIGGHTVTHPILTKLKDEAAFQEIIENKHMLEQILDKPVRLFAYPNGKVGIDFDERHVQMVKDAGYEAAFTTAIGAATRHSDLFQLPRSRPWDATPLKFELRLLSWLAHRGA